VLIYIFNVIHVRNIWNKKSAKSTTFKIKLKIKRKQRWI